MIPNVTEMPRSSVHRGHARHQWRGTSAVWRRLRACASLFPGLSIGLYNLVSRIRRFHVLYQSPGAFERFLSGVPTGPSRCWPFRMCRSVPQTPQAPILMSAALLEPFGHGTVWITGWAPGPAKVETRICSIAPSRAAANLRTRDRAFVTPRRRGVNARAPAARHRSPARSA